MFEEIFKYRCTRVQVNQRKYFKVQSQVHKGLINQCSSSITSAGVMTQMSNVNQMSFKINHS